jgi:quinoprotein dehydrogenase-associated probable ABC transporter substrate-binding protein
MNLQTRTKKTWILLGALTLALALMASSAWAQGQAQTGWNMRVCADPNHFPASSKQQPGFENRIAEILADQLHAKLTFVWTRRGSDMVKYHLRTGDCDLSMEVADGADGVLSTIPYYQSPYVFIYRKSSGLDIHSLTDPALKKLRIGTYAYSIPFVALKNEGLLKNIIFYHPVGSSHGPDFNSPLLQHLKNGDVDLAIVYGPVAGNFAKQHPGEWVLNSVTPEIVPPSLYLSRIWTIAVRPGDESLRDELGVALAQKWDEIQKVLHDYNVPLQSLPRPVISIGQ